MLKTALSPSVPAPLGLQRQEHKYLLPLAKALTLKATLSRALAEDSHNVDGGYLVRSLYFDTPDNRDLHETLDGLYHRRKIRLRTYSPDAQTVNLELKRKEGSRQEKITIPVSRQDALTFCGGCFSSLLDGGPAAKSIYPIVSQGYHPVSVVDYRRTAFVWPARSTRITLDECVQSCDSHLDLFCPKLPLVPALPAGYTVLEVKYDGTLETFIKQLLTGYCNERLSVSKYANGRLAGYWAAAL